MSVRPLTSLSQARLPLVHSVEVTDHTGRTRVLAIPAERPLTIYLDKRELVTLMTLGQYPEWLVLGYLRNQQWVRSVSEVASVTVDWDVGAAAVCTWVGPTTLDGAPMPQPSVVTTGCGQGSMFAALMADVERWRLPESGGVRQSQVYALVNAFRRHESVYQQSGSVHGCALFRGAQLRLFVEDVGRHNAVDTIAGWLGLQESGVDEGAVLYTTGRLTSEMVIKAAQMGVPVVVSRSGITQMGWEVAQKVGLCAIGRARHDRFLCFSHPQRLVWDVGGGDGE